MTYCHNCGAQMQEGDLFCRECGARIIQKDAAAVQPVPPVSAAQPVPAAQPVSQEPTPPAEWVCPICGAKNAAEANNCASCGGGRPPANRAGAFKSTTEGERNGAISPTAKKWLVIGAAAIALLLAILALCGVFDTSGGKAFDEFYDGLEGYWAGYDNEDWYCHFEEDYRVFTEGGFSDDSYWEYEIKSVKKLEEGKYRLNLDYITGSEEAGRESVYEYNFESYITVSFYDYETIAVVYSSVGDDYESYYYYVGDDYNEIKSYYDEAYADHDEDYGFDDGDDYGFNDDIVVPEPLGDLGECMVDNAEGVFMYAGPGEDFVAIYWLGDAETAEVRYKQDGWLYVDSADDVSGWISESNIIYREN